MATGWGSPSGIFGVIMIILGIILAIVAIVLLINYQNQTIPWWVWFMLILGVILAIIGGILLAMALSSSKKKTVVYAKKDQCSNEYVPMINECEDYESFNSPEVDFSI